MEIWEPKPPGTLWATLGLLRDSFNFYPHFIFCSSLQHAANCGNNNSFNHWIIV